MMRCSEKETLHWYIGFSDYMCAVLTKIQRGGTKRKGSNSLLPDMKESYRDYATHVVEELLETTPTDAAS